MSVATALAGALAAAMGPAVQAAPKEREQIPGWVNSYAIVGGTGKYAGARGEMTLILMPDGKTFRAVSRFTL